MVNAHDDRDNQRFTLEELGITKSTDVYGDEHLTIVLPPNSAFGSGEAQALFDESTRKWELKITGGTKFARLVEGQFKRKAFIHDKVELPSRRVKWTEVLPHTEHVQRFLDDIEWETTSLGPLETWPSSLQAYLNVVFADSQAAVIYWGDDLVALYNESFLKMVSGRFAKAQDLLGCPFQSIWPELWADFEPMLRSIAARGTGLETLEVNLYPYVEDYPEETFWQGSFLPIRESGVNRGFYNRARETTKSVISERRAKVISAIAAKPNLTGDFIYKHVIDCLALASRDFPLSFIYSAYEDPESGKCQLKLQCGEGLPVTGHMLVPSTMELYDGHAGFIPFMRTAKSRDDVVVLHTKDGSLPESLLEGFIWKGFGEPSRSIAILPVSTSDRLLALLVIGLNPRRPYDDDCTGFLSTLARSISSTVASAIDREEARNRAERLAKQLEDREKSIRELAEYGPVGIARLSSSGKLLWANDQYYELSGHGKRPEDHYEMSFLDTVLAEDRAACSNLWSTLSTKGVASSAALRLKRTWQPPATPDYEDSENYITISDISKFKWAEHIQAKSASNAREEKRLQENFIDIVSHEMRNPLSAISQLSESISICVQEYDSTRKGDKDVRTILENNAESAKTILLCAAHQKRIIDDVLTLSKLDSMLLSITPVVVQPYHIVTDVLRMFDAEFTANDIEVNSTKTDLFRDEEIDWVYLDPSRLTQIFINLITNAIKFTKNEPERRITIRVGITLTRPPSLASVTWFPTNKVYKDLTLSSEWGQGPPVYICFEVMDTGRGLEQDEMNKLFGRFQQATEKTHLKYGGSGLGLFISRELTETQGGEIGVKSEPGKGTTFAFYVRGRKADAPQVPATTPASQSLRNAKQPRNEASEHRATQSVRAYEKSQKLSILLCEDNVVNAKILKRQLEKANCEVRVAGHGMEALDLLQKTKAWEGMSGETEALSFDVMLCDLEMPIMDGLTCMRRIRQLEAEGKLHQHTNVIATTAHVRQEQIDVAIQAGSDSVLRKPFQVNECLTEIRRLLQVSQARGDSLNGP